MAGSNYRLRTAHGSKNILSLCFGTNTELDIGLKGFGGL